jgi:NAD dependent epimerase/dehydratase family enzyme
VNLRFGVIISKKDGAFGKLYLIYFLWCGGVVGSGQQYFSHIIALDAARAILHVLETPSQSGHVNIVSPNPCTYREFNSADSKAISQPSVVPLPSFAVRRDGP